VKIETQQIMIGDYEFIISCHTYSLLFTNSETGNCTTALEQKNYINCNLPVKAPKNIKTIRKLDYFPSYDRLSPQQRWIFLNWLQNIENPIGIGYVFIYFYCLCEKLDGDKFELAFNEILRIAQIHKNRSLSAYSHSALFNSILRNERFNLLGLLYECADMKGIANHEVFFWYDNFGKFPIKVIIGIIHSIRPNLNTNYINGKFAFLYEKLLLRHINKNNNATMYPVKTKIDYDILNSVLDIPDILYNIEFIREMTELHDLIHEETKITLRTIRKDKKLKKIISELE